MMKNKRFSADSFGRLLCRSAKVAWIPGPAEQKFLLSVQRYLSGKPALARCYGLPEPAIWPGRLSSQTRASAAAATTQTQHTVCHKTQIADAAPALTGERKGGTGVFPLGKGRSPFPLKTVEGLARSPGLPGPPLLSVSAVVSCVAGIKGCRLSPASEQTSQSEETQQTPAPPIVTGIDGPCVVLVGRIRRPVLRIVGGWLLGEADCR